MLVKAIIFETKWHAEAWNRDNSGLSGNISMYRWRMQPHPTQTSTITKVQYAAFNNIPAQITLEEGGTPVTNPDYTALQANYTVPKWIVIVGNDLDTQDEEGNVIVPENVSEITLPEGGGE